MHAISSYRGNRPTYTQPQTHTQTGLITIQLARSVNISSLVDITVSMIDCSEIEHLEMKSVLEALEFVL